MSNENQTWYPGIEYQTLFDHMLDEHALELLQSEMEDIARLCFQILSRQIADLKAENFHLKVWKESALDIMNKMDLQAIAKEIGLPLGSSIPENILPAINKLKKEIEKGGEECPTK